MADMLSVASPVSAEVLTIGGLELRVVSTLDVVSLGAFAGAQRTALLDRVQERFGVALPEKPGFVSTADGALEFLWCGPSQWLAIAAQGQGLYKRLRDNCGDVCALTTQGDSRTVLRLSGVGADVVLSRLVPVDLHPHAFATGSVALTLAGHVPVILRQVEDSPAAYDLFVFRSFAASLFHDLHAAMSGVTSQNRV